LEGFEIETGSRALTSRKRLLLAVIRTLHFSILLFVMLGWAAPSQSARILHLLLIPILILHWKTNNDTCILTSFEARIRGEELPEEGGFIRSLLERLTTREIPEASLRAGIYGCMATAWIIGAARLL
jgi:hypothetical protein